MTVPIVEGKVYRLGEFKVEGNSIFSEAQIRAVIGLNKGDIADGEKVSKGLFENLKKFYGQQGFIEYTAEPVPTFKDNPANPNEGIVDFTVTIEEGKQFTLRRLEFVGNTFTRDNVLRREVLINEGDIYNDVYWEYSVVKLNQLGYFNPIDKDKDVDRRTNDEEATVDLSLKVSERGRQQISFNGGISGIGGSFFGLEYSTNNLLGRGEVLSFNLAAGNRQRSFQFSFTEPYIKDRPISAGFSVFAFSQKFFGEGTFLSQNISAQEDLLGSQFNFNDINEENLFTRDSYGGSIFVSAPLVGVLSQATIHAVLARRRFVPAFALEREGSGSQRRSEQSEVVHPGHLQAAQHSDQPRHVDVLVRHSQRERRSDQRSRAFGWQSRSPDWAATSALISRHCLTRSFSRCAARSRSIRKSSVSASSPEQWAALRRPQKCRNANSLAFVDGVPIFERFFLGDEFTIRGYNVRSISPIAPVDTFITSQNVVVATNLSGTPTPVPGFPPVGASLGVFTGYRQQRCCIAAFVYVGRRRHADPRQLRIPHSDHQRHSQSRCFRRHRNRVQSQEQERPVVFE